MTASSAESIGVNGAAAPNQLFVINLAASTSPMALSHPSSPQLKRYTFFVSRQREDGRERFRLHMGYFDTQEKAEELLASVRDIYPAAWAGPAPTTGMGRRGRIAPSSVATAAPPGSSAAPAPAAPAPVAAVPAAPVARTAPAPAPAPIPVAKPAAPVAAPVARAKTPAAPVAPAARKPAPPLDSMSNVRDVIAQLSDATPKAAKELSGMDTLQLLEPPPPRVPASVPVVSPAAAQAPAAAAAAAAAPAAPAAKAAPPTLPPLKNPFEGLENEPEVRLVTPEDTQTLTDIRVDKQNNAPPCFAVQLLWSVSPVDVSTLPHLAIFDAYTLYNVEGNRQGRKWYGLRLGFFSDPNSATQVANYVRSDYKSVAVVPVAVKERDSARGGAPQAALQAPRKTSDTEFKREAMDGFELLSDDRPAPAKRDLDDASRGKSAAAAPRAAPVKPGAPARPAGAPVATGKPTGKRVVARRRPPTPPPGKTVSAGVGGAEVLESTLEILGASTLSLDEGREVIHDNAARKPVEKKSGGRFSRLLSRLGGG